jgi:predicted Fe-Mo cluster-binding NifX family protein
MVSRPDAGSSLPTERSPTRILLAIDDERVAARFDRTTEVVVATVRASGELEKERTVVLPRAAPDELCHLVITEGVDVVVCDGIEEEYFDYLTWKRVRVIDSVMGPWREALHRACRGRLAPLTNLDRGGEGAR